MKRFRMIFSALSQLLNVVTAFDVSKTGPNESVSARMHRQGRKRREGLINALIFWEDEHCKASYLSDVSDARSLLAEHEAAKGASDAVAN